ncbi:helix-turn-helix domain-containing protein [Dermabacter jinjuensis]|uniref:DNA-binding protein n=1 Tax=Dermabacter jinjuensis TaxID=1667168 RepID=A0ABN5DXB7_9MICO|nr:DNA-binding protein [Dermabacter jinjuensis]UEB89943.1 helix-turn-helix domain-containing protein [Dermabacter jinjuensis]
MTINYQNVGVIPQWSRGDRLRKAREVAGLDQATLAERIGSSRRTVSSAENGEREPRRAVVMAWAMATGVPFEWIENGDVKSPPPSGEGLEARPEGFEPPTF